MAVSAIMNLRPVMLCLAFTTGLHSQDLGWSNFQWLSHDDSPDALPEARRLWAPSVPEALKPHLMPEYAEVHMFIPARGAPTIIDVSATVPWLDISMAQNLRDAAIGAAKRSSKAVDSEALIHLIFNPAASGKKPADAMPRLLHVVPPSYPELESGEQAKTMVALAVVDIDAEGRITNVNAELNDNRFVQPLIAAVKQWTFAAARQGGQPVASSIKVPVLFEPRVGPEKDFVKPKVISQSNPIYPRGYHLAGIGGQVHVGFVVTVEGRVSDAYVLRSTQPGFDEAALDAVRRWRFQPGRVGDRPVNTRMEVPLHFLTEEEKTFQVRRPKNFPPELPETFHFDVPPDLIDMLLPHYPVEALEAGAQGKVKVTFAVDPRGVVVQSRVVGEPPPALAGAARAAIEALQFKPAARAGEACYALLTMELEFDRTGNRGHAPVTDEMRRILRVLERSPEALSALADLDKIPEPLSRPAPRRPTRLPWDASAEVVVEFVIDRQGLARLPRVISSTHDDAGPAAAMAISQWRFEPPRRAGRAVDALVRIPVNFASEE